MSGLTRSQNELSAGDYVIFSLFLLISAGIGIFFAFYGGKQKTTKEFLLGNRSMPLIPVIVSILVSFTSAILILGSPAEFYINGTLYFYYPIGMAVGCVVAAFVFVPLLYPLNLTSAFEYLEKRFDSRSVKIVGSLLFVLQGIVYAGLAMFAPSIALEGMSQKKFSKYLAIVISGLVGTLYTMLGGLKGVVWTDVFQGGIMLLGILIILIQSHVQAGGSSEVFYWSSKYGRLIWSDWSVDPTERHTIWGLILGTAVMWTGIFGVNQASVQRFCSLPTKRKAMKSLLFNIPAAFILVWCSCFCGLSIFSYYIKQDCDIRKAGWASNNQIVPYYVMEKMNLAGFPGLFSAALFSGGLSSVSSTLNGCAAILWKDILQPFVFSEAGETKSTIINKILVACFGVLSIGMAILASTLGGTVLQASIAFNGAIGGPSLGLFFLGAFFPWANWIGGIVGPIVGVVMTLWISIGSYSVKIANIPLPTTVEGCLNYTSNLNSNVNMTVPTTTSDIGGNKGFYSMSYLWYSAFGALITIIIGLLVSIPFEIRRKTAVNPKYIYPFFHKLCCCFPVACKNTASCGYTREEMCQNEDTDLEIPKELQFTTVTKDLHIQHQNSQLPDDDINEVSSNEKAKPVWVTLWNKLKTFK